MKFKTICLPGSKVYHTVQVDGNYRVIAYCGQDVPAKSPSVQLRGSRIEQGRHCCLRCLAALRAECENLARDLERTDAILSSVEND